MAVLSHEGTFSILYGSLPLPMGAVHRTGYLARPDAAGKFAVIFVFPSIEGLTGVEKDLCRRLARHGFAAVGIDFYRGDSTEPIISYNAVPDERVLADIDETYEFVTSEDVDWAAGGGIGILGIDVGGRFGLIRSATRPWVRSLVVADTPLTGDEERSERVADYLSNLPIPVLGLYGAEDQLISSTTIDEAQRRNDHGQWLLYQDAGHGFLNIDSDGFDQSAADDAWARIVAFFQATLPKPERVELG